MIRRPPDSLLLSKKRERDRISPTQDISPKFLKETMMLSRLWNWMQRIVNELRGIDDKTYENLIRAELDSNNVDNS
jgi:hypothetical protein